MRFTPAGVPVTDSVIKHQSQQQEAGVMRWVQGELPVVAIGEVASKLADLKVGDKVKLTGFLNRKNQTNQQLVLHVNHIIQI